MNETTINSKTLQKGSQSIMFTKEEQCAIGQALLDGTFQKLSSEQQMRLLMRGFIDASEEQLSALIEGLNRAYSRGLIRFSPQRLYQRIKGSHMEEEIVATSMDPQDVTEAAHSLTGFDARRLIQQPTEKNETFPLSQLPQNKGKVDMPLTQQKPMQQQVNVAFPEGYVNMSKGQKIEVIRNMINSHAVKNISGIIFKDVDITDVNAVAAAMEKYFTFIIGSHYRIDILQLITVGRIARSMRLKNLMKQYGCTDDPEEPHFVEVQMDQFAPDAKDKYDFAFLMQCNDRSKGLLLLVNSIPVLDNLGKWVTSYEARAVQFGKDKKNPFIRRPNKNNNSNKVNDGIASIGEVITSQP